jgi:hypothetical protein
VVEEELQEEDEVDFVEVHEAVHAVDLAIEEVVEEDAVAAFPNLEVTTMKIK